MSSESPEKTEQPKYKKPLAISATPSNSNNRLRTFKSMSYG